MSRIQADEVKKVATMARIGITEEEAETFSTQLDAFLTFAEQLNEVDTTDVKPMTHVLDTKNVLREDRVEKGLQIEDILKNAPDYDGKFIRVPSILE